MDGNGLMEWLRQEHDKVFACEAEALALLEKRDIEGYNQKMRAKAELLASIDARAEHALEAAPPDLAQRVERELAVWARSAQTALALNSVFYMSALLYRDDHKKGEPDNFEVFINGLKQA